MDQLAFDLVLYLHEQESCAMVVRIEERIPTESPPGYDNGTLRGHIVEVIHGPITANSITVPYSRMVDPLLRAKSSLNHWNALSLDVGSLLLLVVTPSADGNSWQALSGNQVASTEDSVVGGLRECYRIKDLRPESEEHQAALSAGLVGANPLPRRYALDAICRHEVVSRDVGCALITKAIGTQDLGSETLLRFADRLSSIPLFDEDQKADTVNQQVVTSLASIIDRLEKPEARATCVRYLASCVLADFDSDVKANGKTRLQLLHAIGKSPPKPVTEALASLASSKNADDRAIAKELVDAWRTCQLKPELDCNWFKHTMQCR